jgi:hypothetical protein
MSHDRQAEKKDMKRTKWFCCCLALMAARLSSPQEKIVVFYGLNDSHSKSWVRENADGVVGISFFQRFEGNRTNGALLYKAISPGGYEDQN